jgi:hypothetical protein
MSQIDLWRKAAECARAREATTDPHARQVLTQLRNLWVNLANERRTLGETQLGDHVKAVSLMHASLMQPTISDFNELQGEQQETDSRPLVRGGLREFETRGGNLP